MQNTARTGTARRDDKMSRRHIETTSEQAKVEKKKSNAKRRNRDKKLD